MLLSLAAAALFYILPLLIGYGMLNFIRRGHSIPSAWIIGVLLLTLLVGTVNAGSSYLGVDDITRIWILRIGILLLTLPGTVMVRSVFTKLSSLLNKEWLITVIFTVAVITIGALVWRVNSPYPSPLNWDMYEHLTLVEEMRSGEFSLALRDYSDTFLVNTYLPFYHVLLLIPSLIISVDPFGYYWMLEMAHYVTVVIVSGLLAWTLTRSKWATIISVLFGGFVFESYIAYTSLFHLPQTIAAVLSIFMIVAVIESYRKQRPLPWWVIGTWSLYLGLSHYFVGTVAATVLVFIYAFLFLIRDRESKGVDKAWIYRWLNVLITIVSVLLLVVIFNNDQIGFNPFQSEESRYFDLNLEEKVRVLQNWYGYSLFILLPLGAFIGLVKRNLWLKVTVFIALGMFMAILFPFPYNLKLYTIARFFIHVVMAIGLGWLINKVTFKPAQIALFCVWGGVMSLVFTFNQQFEFKQYIRYHGLYTHVTAAEIEAAQFLNSRFPDKRGVFLVSEPSTQYILEAYTGINTQGGSYMDDRSRQLVDFTFPNPDSELIAQSIRRVEDQIDSADNTVRLFAVSGRFFEWQQSTHEQRRAHFYNIWRPRDLTQADSTYIDFLKNSPEFELLFHNQSMAIFALRKV